MLIQLKIQNLILVDLSTIVFEKGLNILTGETGSGKSAILEAIFLILGARADIELIGKHADHAVVEAEISQYNLIDDIHLPENKEPITIRREIYKSGKNRTFVNDQQISLSQLKQLVGNWIEIIEQSSSSKLFYQEYQRQILDTFAKTTDLAKELEKSYSQQLLLQKQIEDLMKAQETRNRDLQWASDDLSFIEEINWKKEEDAELTERHKNLIHAEQTFEKLSSVSEFLEQNTIKKALQLLDSVCKVDSNLQELYLQLKNANLEIEDVKRSIASKIHNIDTDPKSIETIENRMAQIDQLKRRFGKNFDDVQNKISELQEKINTLTNLDEELSCLQKLFKNLEDLNQRLALNLSQKRQAAAITLSEILNTELHTLNFPNAQFAIDFKKQNLTSFGVDSIEFLFSANAGHTPISIDKCASGGELSRLLFSIKKTICDLDHNSCLIFDEIDSNVGGQTASILAEKLKQMSTSRQIICITHFIQVAKLGDAHYKVFKQEHSGKTISTVTKLSAELRNEEYDRMLGSR